jgi:hypothetical protein
MKAKLLLLTLLFFVISGCVSTNDNVIRSQDTTVADPTDAKYQKLYYDYRAQVTETINSNNKANLSRITDEYISKTGKGIFLITVSQLDPSGKWNVLLHKADPNMPTKLAAVHYARSESVHIRKMDDYVSCESNKTKNGTYKDNIHIRMAIKR